MGGASSAGGSSPSTDPGRDLHSFLFTLLDFQCRLVQAAAGVVYLSGSAARNAGIVATCASGRSGEGTRPTSELLNDVMVRRLERLGADAVAAAGRGGSNALSPDHLTEDLTLGGGVLYEARATHRAVAVPLMAQGRAEGATVVIVPIVVAASDAALRIGLTGARFEAFLWRQQCLNEAGQKARLREALELLDSAQQGADAGTMGSILCHELQRRFGCTRVSIGLVKGDNLRLVSVSGADDLDRRGAAVVAIEAAMEECAGQDIEVLYPPPPETEHDPSERRVTRAHEDLSRKFGPAAMVSLPLRVEGDLAGVVLMERESLDPFPVSSLSLLRLVAEFIGPAVWTRRLADRGTLAVMRDRSLEIGSEMVGPRHTGAKLLGLLVVAALVLLAAVPIPDRVRAEAEIKPALSRTIAPPFIGFLESVKVRPGDVVEAGDVLATMSDKELQLQLAKVRAARDTLVAQRDEAQGKSETSKVRSFSAQIQESDADIARVTQLIDWCRIVSPIDGVVSRGDLDPFLGAKVEPSQPLLEVAARERLVVVRIPERDASRVARVFATNGLEGLLATKALPDRKVAVRLRQLNPSSEVVDGANVYLGEAELSGPDASAEAEWLRPGMTGTVKLRDGWTTGLSLIVRPITDELRMKFWW